MWLIISGLSVVLVVTNGAIVNVPSLGLIEGTETESSWTNRTIQAFYGIRFGLSPSGSRRFMPPEPAEPWNGVYNATYAGKECPQLLKSLVPQNPEEDIEDCLFLNVFTPSLNNSDLLPVMVFFHGGGFYEGSAKTFPPNYLLENDVLLVVIQYRLGPLGFLSLETDGIAGNVGMMDQVLGIKWVNEYIESFGGDKNQVTLFGQSAGAASASLMLFSPLVDDTLFQKVILQSGSAFGGWVIDNNPTIFSKALFNVLTDSTDDVDTDVMEEYFKNSTVFELQSALFVLLTLQPRLSQSVGKVVVQKAGSTKFLESHPNDILRAGKIRAVPMMVGVTKHDGSYLATVVYDNLENLNLTNDSDFLRIKLTEDLLRIVEIEDNTGTFTDILENKYFKRLFDKETELTFADVAPGVIDLTGTLFFKAPGLEHAKANALKDKPSFLYTFDYKGEHTRFGYGEDTTKYPFDGGVHHSNDNLYLFPYHYDALNEADTRMAKIMVNLWTSFAINGIPSSPESAAWEPLKPGRKGPYYHINETSYLDTDFVDKEYSIATYENENRSILSPGTVWHTNITEAPETRESSERHISPKFLPQLSNI